MPMPPRYNDRTMIPGPEEAAELGRAVVADGRLKILRNRLRITRSAMAGLLHTNMVTYADWERRPEVRLRPATAQRVGRFYHAAIQELDLLAEYGLDTDGLVPFHIMATLLGMPQEVLLQWYREERFTAVDAGILGLWVKLEDLNRLRSRR